MSKAFLVSVIVGLVVFGGSMVWINAQYEQRFDELLESCPKPAQTPEREQVFYFAKDTPLSMGVMVR